MARPPTFIFVLYFLNLFDTTSIFILIHKDCYMTGFCHQRPLKQEHGRAIIVLPADPDVRQILLRHGVRT